MKLFCFLFGVFVFFGLLEEKVFYLGSLGFNNVDNPIIFPGTFGSTIFVRCFWGHHFLGGWQS